MIDNSVSIFYTSATVSRQIASSSFVGIAHTFTLESGVNPTDIQDSVNNVVDNYFKSLSANWDKEDNLIARISQLEIRLLGVAGVLDITNTKMNNSSSNLSLQSNEIPVRQGDVVINV